MASFLKTFAIAAGAGVAFGLCASVGRNRLPQVSSTPDKDKDPLDVEPLLDRLESIERRLEIAKPVAAMPDISRRIDAQEAEIERLRALVDVRAGEIEQRLTAEMHTRQRQALATIESSVERKIADRIAAIESTLAEQSASISSLNERAHDTDENLKRLIAAIEKLCERTQAAPAPAPFVVPFEAHLNEARERQEDPASEYRARIFKEADEKQSDGEPRKTRFPLARIFGMIALVALTQLLVH